MRHFATFPTEPKNSERKSPSGFSSIRRLLPYLRPHWGALAVANACMLAGTVIGLFLPYLTGKVMDASLLRGGVVELNKIIFALLFLALLGGIFQYGQTFFLDRTSYRVLHRLRFDLYSHLLSLDVGFYEKRNPGELISRLMSDLTAIQSYTMGAIPTGLRGIVRFVMAAVVLCWIQPKLALLALVVVPPVGFFGMISARLLRSLSTKQIDANAFSTSMADEAFSGIRTIKALGRESYESSRYEAGLDRLLDLQIRNMRIWSFLGALFAAISAIGSILVLSDGAHLMVEGKLSPGQLAAFMLYALSMAGTINLFASLFIGYQSAIGASVRVFEIFNARDPKREVLQCTASPLHRARLKGDISFEKVCFEYPEANGHFALQDLSFQAKPGETIGIVGPSGAGKSTIFSLLLGFYGPTSGSIKIDGHDVNSIDFQELRQSLALVPQDIFMFSGTIEDNIRYGKLDATPEELRAAAVGAGAHEFIEQFPNRYAEIVGPRGIRLSAGQRQRIAVARAFLMNPSILLLDEATSALDPDSEEAIRKALIKLVRDRTTLVIAHRLATARRADRILVVERGRIMTVGTHDTLYVSNPLYKRYWDLQALTSV